MIKIMLKGKFFNFLVISWLWSTLPDLSQAITSPSRTSPPAFMGYSIWTWLWCVLVISLKKKVDKGRTPAALLAATIFFFLFMGGRFRELKELGSAEILMMLLKDKSYRAHADSCPDAQRLWHSALSSLALLFPKLRSKEASFFSLSGDYADKADKKNGGKAIILNSGEEQGKCCGCLLEKDKNLRAKKCTATDEQKEKVSFNEGVC